MSTVSQIPPKEYCDTAVQTEHMSSFSVPSSAIPTVICHEPRDAAPETRSSNSDPIPLAIHSLPHSNARYSGLTLRRPVDARRVASMPTAGPNDQAPTPRILSLPVPGRFADSDIQLSHAPDVYDSAEELDYDDRSHEGPFANLRESLLDGLPRTPSPQTPSDLPLTYAYSSCFSTAYTQLHNAWSGSPPRPIPALHGPLSLPYARCPSGAEGTIVDGDNLSHKVWGLGTDEYPTPRESRSSPETVGAAWAPQDYNYGWPRTETHLSKPAIPLAGQFPQIHTHLPADQQPYSLPQARPTYPAARMALSDPRQIGIGMGDPTLQSIPGTLHPSALKRRPPTTQVCQPKIQPRRQRDLQHASLYTGDAFASPDLFTLPLGHKSLAIDPLPQLPPQIYDRDSTMTVPSMTWSPAFPVWSPGLGVEDIYQSLLIQHAHRPPVVMGSDSRFMDSTFDQNLRPDITAAIVRSKSHSEFLSGIHPGAITPATPASPLLRSTLGGICLSAKDSDVGTAPEDVKPPGSHHTPALNRTPTLLSGSIQAPRSVPLARLVQRRLSSVPEEGKSMFLIESTDPRELRAAAAIGTASRTDWTRNHSNQKENSDPTNNMPYSPGVKNAPKSTSRSKPIQRRARPARASPYKKRHPDNFDGDAGVI